MADPAPTPLACYRRRAELHDDRVASLERASVRLGGARALVFVGGALALLLADRLPGTEIVWRVAGAVAAVGFALFVARHRRLRKQLVRSRTAAGLAREGAARLERRWSDLPPPAAEPEEAGEHHPYARDLDLYGRVSIRTLLGRPPTPMGARTLDGWLLGDDLGSTPPERTAATRELAARPDLLEEAALEGALLDPVSPAVLGGFRAWLREPDLSSGAARVVRWLLPGLTALGVAGAALAGWPGAAWVVPLTAQAVVALRSGGRLHASFARASSGAPGLRRYHRLFAVWEGQELDAPLLTRAVARLSEPGHERASAALSRLARWLDAADARLSGMLHPVLAVGVLWDLHVAAGLDRWRREHAGAVPGWLDALGELEALAALAVVGADHPDWAWPDHGSEDTTLRASGLGHPLLPGDACVRNDVEVGPPGSILWVTGSNMSGKSTLLRSIGLAAVMARAGAPVCATALVLPRVRTFTSMRIRDSLEEGVSHFMAELGRLRSILDAARSDDPRPVLYLIDEVLQGTNSEERRVAGRRVVRELLRRPALGALTTHDLELHRHPEIEAAAVLAHFRETVGETGDRLTFDYRLRPGLATTRNALLLAERMGITDPDGPEA